MLDEATQPLSLRAVENSWKINARVLVVRGLEL